MWLSVWSCLSGYPPPPLPPIIIVITVLILLLESSYRVFTLRAAVRVRGLIRTSLDTKAMGNGVLGSFREGFSSV